MKTLLVILSLGSGLSHAQQYLSLHDRQVVYDVDVVVFARQLSQPAAETINNADLVATETAKILADWDQQTPLFKQPDIEATADEDESNWQVPLDSDETVVDALTWINLDRSMDHGVIKRLRSNPTIMPLLHNKWRQPATPFLQPEYVRVTSFAVDRPVWSMETESTEDTEPEPLMDSAAPSIVEDTQNNYDQYFAEQPTLVSDYSVDGMLAFSQQKFTHLHVKFNLYRVNAADQQIIYGIAQQKRIKLGEWQYFDHQQFGVLAKVTAVKPSNEESP